MSHTPGPWNVGMRSGANSNTIYARDGIDQFHDTSICSVYGMFMHADIEDQKDGEGLANARLIAATPDLLSALKGLVDSFDPGTQFSELATARAAIKKAEGQS